MSEPFERLQEARKRAGFDNPTDAARAFGWNEVTYRSHENGTRGLKPPIAERYGRAFKINPGWLLTGHGDPGRGYLSETSEILPSERKLRSVPIVGRVAAGVFREVIEYDDDEPQYLFAERDEEFPDARMFALVVEGDSMNDATPPILEGSRVVCVDFEETGLPLTDGLLVVVERTTDGGMVREWSVKEVEYHADRVEYHPRSRNKRHRPIVVAHDAGAEDSEVRVLGVVRQINYSVPIRPKRR
ncbi:MAG TPA: S24 family peptidase [Microvirga sp.]|jgi:SOS-response transcriptional repressor LexA|nr:S24 family peptidase [Microvirga sp.]